MIYLDIGDEVRESPEAWEETTSDAISNEVCYYDMCVNMRCFDRSYLDIGDEVGHL